MERKEANDWVSACKNLKVAGSKGRGKPIMYDLESMFGWGYEGYGAKDRDGNGP